ncbi:MAG TPA: hypothetical protein VHG08_02125 [Longimicrobium sp.]|nr:hypothetical protein [Longimicrobium sp.]
MHILRIIPAGILLLASCGAPQAEYDRLLAENQTLRRNLTAAEARVKELEATPANRLAAARGALAAGDTGRAESALRELTRAAAGTAEARQGAELLDAIEQNRAAARAEVERRARLGFRVLEPRSTADFADGSLKVNSVQRGNRWISDRRSTGYSSEWQYRDAPRGSDFVLADVSISSESHNPSLPPIYVYRLEGGALRHLATMRYEFYRWRDYGSYLGNYADYHNEFSHSRTVRFSAGAEIEESRVNGAPIYVLAGRAGCFTRSRDQFRTPAVGYEQGSCPAEPSLSVERVQAGYTVLRVLGASATANGDVRAATSTDAHDP